ncbi:hybrid sensor histidine kinase/response regulator [Pseudomonas sp. 5P_3.1_Bac2]|uniref:hybrid sensor histidine kinase/response regulator n=1 Tax=Pseudomonas sp. 5P_3.1_Bac2 TaxID=2971617 RepID=UPI0021C87A7A|nr:hybrid sensor histidine kinase/response regulator [Pseudomonas sp. 5P_3.1_Bac2]MCU1717101.1 ATP-binding protein [Pseudomonas sp. 5P_3.1_Bac2]
MQEAEDKIHFHFTRLMGDIQEHERFLATIAHQSDAVTQARDRQVVPLQQLLVGVREGLAFYEGREFSFAMPFSLARTDTPIDVEHDKGVFALGVMLANFYSRFWSLSAYPSPQTAIIDLHGHTSLAVPAFGHMPLHENLTWQTYPRSLGVMRKLLARAVTRHDLDQVHWAPTQDFINGHPALMGYVRAKLPDALWWQQDPGRQIIAVTLLDMQRINDYEQVLERQVFDSLDLLSPEGQLLMGQGSTNERFNPGLNFTTQGVVIKVISDDNQPWVAQYHLGYRVFFQYAKWQLLGAVLLAMLAVLGGWLVKRWYARRVIQPASAAHQHLQESESFSRTIIQTAPVALCVVQRSDQRVMVHNTLAQTWLGNPEQISTLIRELCRFDQADQLIDPLNAVTARVGERYLHGNFAQTRFQGQQAILCVFNDVSAHKEVEQTLAQAKRAADAASEAKSVFLATMSHEIRTPLYGALGTLELLGLTDLNARQRTYLETIQGSSVTLLQLISDILDVSKIEAGQMVLEHLEFSPLQMLEEVIRSYAGTAANKGLLLYSCIDPEVPERLLGDAVRIRQILNNLLSNAIKFTELGRVVLRLKVAGRSAKGIQLQWQITDTGIGIGQEQQVRLFESFYQVSDSHTTSGTGLGLAICSRLCSLMEGDLQVVSELGLGSSFTLTLPLQEARPAMPALHDIHLDSAHILLRAPLRELSESISLWLIRWGLVVDCNERGRDASEADLIIELLPEPQTNPQQAAAQVLLLADGSIKPQYVNGAWQVSLHSLRGIAQAVQATIRGEYWPEQQSETKPTLEKLPLRVLVAEDNPVNQALIAEQLQALGCSATICADGREALGRFEEEEFDVVLTDLNMPNLNGYELTRTLRARGVGLPIIGVTANALREEVQRGRDAGMNAWLVKPMSLQALYECLHRAVGQRPLAEAPAPSAKTPLEVPQRMHKLFMQTMREDLRMTREALSQADFTQVRQRIHRMRGSLAVVQARHLEAACGEVENQLSSLQGEARLHRVSALLEQIEAALASL